MTTFHWERLPRQYSYWSTQSAHCCPMTDWLPRGCRTYTHAYQTRMLWIGSTRVARSDGTRHAAATTTNRPPTTPRYVVESSGWTPYSMRLSNLPLASA